MSAGETQQRNGRDSLHTAEAAHELAEISSDPPRALQRKSLMVVKYIQWNSPIAHSASGPIAGPVRARDLLLLDSSSIIEGSAGL